MLCLESNPVAVATLRESLQSTRRDDVDEDLPETPADTHVEQSALVTGALDFDPRVPATWLDSVLEFHRGFQHARLLRLELPNLDLALLKGAMGFVQRAKPVVSWRHSPYQAPAEQDRFAVFRFLSRRGYQTSLIYDDGGQFVCACRLDDLRLLEDLQARMMKTRSLGSAFEIVAFAPEDTDLADQIRDLEVDA